MEQKNQLQIDRVISGYIKGIAITFVVLGHILGGRFGLLDTYTTALLGSGGVSVFLLLSGYGLYQSYRQNGLQPKAYWEKKLQKIFFPYSVITVIYYVYLMVCQTAPGASVLLLNILCVDYSRSMDGTMWYMSFLLIWYILFFCVFFFKGRLYIKVGLLCLFGLAFSDSVFKSFFDQCSWQFAVNSICFPCGVGLGYLMELFNEAPISHKHKTRLCAGVRIAVLTGSLAILVLGGLQVIKVLYCVWGFALFFVLYPLLRLPKKEIKVLKWLGANSFLIYLLEGKLIGIWNHFRTFNKNPAVYLLSYAAAMIALVCLYHFGSTLARRLCCKIQKN